MITVLLLLGYAAAAACLAPALLTPLTSRGRSARAGLAAWLAALAGVVCAAVLALVLAVSAAAADWPHLTQTLCRSVAGDACSPAVYRSALYQAGVAALAIALAVAAVIAAWRYGRRVRRSRIQTRGHARAALLVGRALASGALAGPGLAHPDRAYRDVSLVPGARTVVLDDQRPAAYCVAGRPAAVVVTSGALALLEAPQLRAVLAHESAHLAHGHHRLATVIRGLAAACPGIPLFTRAVTEVGRLTEMTADDSAARQTGRATVASALIALATGQTAGPATETESPAAAPLAGPRASLAAAALAVPARVDRLLAPSRPGVTVAATVLLAALAALLAAGPALLAVLG